MLYSNGSVFASGQNFRIGQAGLWAKMDQLETYLSENWAGSWVVKIDFNTGKYHSLTNLGGGVDGQKTGYCAEKRPAISIPNN